VTRPFEAWFSFRLAAETVERRLGVSWGMAQKLLLEAIESGVIRSKLMRAKKRSIPSVHLC
jgi:hypothetical protein